MTKPVASELSRDLNIHANLTITKDDLVAIRKIFLETGSLRYSLKEIEKRLSGTMILLEGLKMRQPYKGVIQDAILKLAGQ